MSPKRPKPKKHLGQNFLICPNTIASIMAYIRPKSFDHIVEIGPGHGALTNDFLTQVQHLTAIDIDPEMISSLSHSLQNTENLALVEQDACTVDFRQFKNPSRLVGNLPYHITTPLLFHFLGFCDVLTDLHCLVQQEVADRIIATPGHKSYGRLTVMIQYRCQVERLLQVPAHAFYPKPKVDSTFIRLIPHIPLPHVALDGKIFAWVVKCAFGQRRKMLRQVFRSYFPNDWLMDAGITPTQRAEEISVKSFVDLSNILTHNRFNDFK